eukprot:CAMPEP_0185770762 /NCGR_PEP_ID=MMETSP1174-20130828/61020_1 /TAXON_ID=35687 /ORGANISM="Dictyocha speculum, Strain CCMP1381" /LENGTH=119 /DNA_ID=CAMNT_0028456337 /DNA_START=29 /DNA_END=385 /DNA_ORIENTATION=-
MMASAADQAGVGHRLVGIDELVDACEALIRHALARDSWWTEFVQAADTNGQNKYGLDAETFRKVMILSTMRLQGVVQVAFMPVKHVQFFMSRTNQISESQSVGPVNVEWPLGAVMSTDW